jgi:hypothetical protein
VTTASAAHARPIQPAHHMTVPAASDVPSAIQKPAAPHTTGTGVARTARAARGTLRRPACGAGPNSATSTSTRLQASSPTAMPDHSADSSTSMPEPSVATTGMPTAGATKLPTNLHHSADAMRHGSAGSVHCTSPVEP